MLENSASFNFEDINQIFPSKDIVNFSFDWFCSGISIDTRTLKEGNLFIAIKGENNDGHDFIQSAIDKNASAVIIDNDWYSKNKPLLSSVAHIIVENTLHILGSIANYHRRRFSLPIIAIGGSNGKTTTKEMTAHLLSKKYKVLKTYKNFNNQIGVPLMLLQLDNSYDIAVLELGTNEPGEMAILTKITEPNFGLITNIGKEHLEKLIDLDGVELEETLLYGWLHKSGGLAFINMQDERLKKYYYILENKFTYSLDYETNVKAYITLNNFLNPSIEITYQDRTFKADLRTIGYASGLNALASSSIALYFGLNDEEIKYGLETYLPEKWHGYGRMYMEKKNNFTIINDCYNANPSSMKMALDTIKNFQFKGEKIAILGDMRELGESSFAEHKNIIEIALNSVDRIFLYGDEMKRALLDIEPNKYILHFNNHKEIADYLLSIDDEILLLLKGSRGMKMEEIFNFLK